MPYSYAFDNFIWWYILMVLLEIKTTFDKYNRLSKNTEETRIQKNILGFIGIF